jgi:serine/threonine-protein kinase
LQKLLGDALPEQEQTALAGHLDTCVTCQQTLEQMAAGNQSWSAAARRMVAPPAPEPALEQAIQALKAQPTEAETLAPSVPSAQPELDFLGVAQPADKEGFIGRLGPYDILEEIGRGGMGIVLKGFDATLHRFVAIKVMAPHLAAQAEARQRFLREARAAAAVVHENVVTIHAVVETDDLPYLVMEFVPAGSLQHRLDSGVPLELTEILRIGKQTAAGLAAAHARGLVHRDIKPANILIEQGSGRVKITDFGLARIVEEPSLAPDQIAPWPVGVDARLSQVGTIAGTPQYMAPEQARGQAVDHRADLFSLGSVLYALCTGRAPFAGDTLVAVLHDVCESSPRPVAEINRDIPGWLVQVIDKLHAKDPAARYQTAAEVAEVLGRHLAILEHPGLAPTHLRNLLGYEYRSRRTLWGWPLVHIATGFDPHTGRQRVARGIIAIGSLAVGGVAIGAGAIGGIAIGGGAVGLIALGGLSAGLLLAVGGLALGSIALGGIALGGIALGGGAVGYYALGSGAYGIHALGSNDQDPQAVEFFRHWLGSWINDLISQKP